MPWPHLVRAENGGEVIYRWSEHRTALLGLIGRAPNWRATGELRGEHRSAVSILYLG
jgi:hypothetical protein